MAANLEVGRADLGRKDDRDAVVGVIDAYASDPAGGGRPLPDDVRARLATALHEFPTARVYLARADGRVAGAAVCFLGLSTFQARPILNVHDIAVLPTFRRLGVGAALLAAVEHDARVIGCCRLTLEVQEDNEPALGLYRKAGFSDFTMGDSAPTRFLAKPLEPSPPGPGSRA